MNGTVFGLIVFGAGCALVLLGLLIVIDTMKNW